MAKTSPGEYSNQGSVIVTMTVANTLAFQKIESGMGIFEKMAWILHRIELFFSVATLTELAAATDEVIVAITTSNNLTSLALDDPSVVTYFELAPVLHGAAANLETMPQPFIRDFTALPSGGVLVVPNPLYLAMVTAGFATARSCTMRYFFSSLELSDQDYLSLIQSRRLVS